MYFAIISQDIPDSLSRRKKARPAHLQRLALLRDEKRLLIAGPFPDPEKEGFTGSLVVADFGSPEQAQSWADADPYVAAGVYADVVVKPFKQVLP
ncbi:MAG: YciI family protein [Magnetococcales bacterium]|nr:YciI family protein [Magnetococcales bacterium]